MNELPENEATANPLQAMSRSEVDAVDPRQFIGSLVSQTSEHDNDRLVPPGQRPCPICGALMQARARASISIDVCPDHGVWLDIGKLEAITENTSVSSKLKQRRDIERMRSRDKLKGTMFGWWSFFID